MRNRGLFGAKSLTGVVSGAAMWLAATAALAAKPVHYGQPTDGEMGLQPGVTELKHDVTWFYNGLLFPIITAICVLVLGLLIWIAIRYNAKANPKPAKFSHNTLIEIIWTAVPVLVLVVIACFSLPLLKKFNDMPEPDVVVKATGNQWFWTYDYPELGVTDVESRLLPEANDINKAKAAGVLYLLSTDNKLVVPVNKVVHVQATAADVMHAFAVPAFGIKIDAVPGRLNNTWFKAERIGTYYGQCSELCGKDHAYMPIEVQVVSEADFDAYIIKAGGKTRAMLKSEAAASAQAEAAAAATAAAAASASAAASADPTAAAAGPSVKDVAAQPAKPAATAAPAATPASAATVN
ncbi:MULTISPECIES: cytochrome c oxidase subunit II [Asticcacaulis]|uniref:cytochrome c oxidase subunit II n=1 Tax=Asticcacaulis TaxID=76890 RepID=UPI001AE2F606|nr:MULTISPECIES: cytochrome c oxidase subunit II [Asticcacaulis]MBP2158955.1 cytochrome c oxidase subunit 2 [Asticcacaulis solisilvae]MDR6800000.1 cytochrome c oxidase subunit 2 [Asticcacaulis sp. BE141]